MRSQSAAAGETIDLYQIHRFDANTPIEETLAALDHVVQSGKVRYIGASSGYAWQFAQALSASERQGWARFVTMQNHYNLLYREEEREMNPLCEKEGIGLMPWSPLARGLLAGSRSGVADRSASTRAATDAYGHTLYDDQSNWSIVAAPIVGATTLSQLEDALGAVELALTAEEIGRLEAPYRPQPVRGIL